MKKLLALLLTFALILGYTACSKPKDNPSSEPPSNSEDNGGKNPTSTLTVAVPEYKDYGRGTVNFDKLVYSRPNMQLLINSFDEVRALVEENAVSVTEQIDAIRKLEAPLSEVKTMYSLSEIYNNKDSSVEYWQGEYEYISTNYPRISKAVEDLLVACAKSSNRAEFENNYFGYSLEKYTDGGIYSDEVVALMAEEARMESEYASLSTANVEIEYNGVDSSIRWKGTVDEVIAMAQEHFKYDEASFERCLMAIDTYYIAARQKIENPLFVELIKIRRLIADELGYEDYHVLGYESMGYDYSAEQMRSIVKYMDLIKISGEECALLTGDTDPEAAATALLAQGAKVVCGTLDAEGALVATNEGCATVPSFRVEAVDTTGAGDSFWGGFLCAFLDSKKKPEEVTLEDAKYFARFGNAVASLCGRKRGAIPAMPTLAEVEKVLA